MCIRDSRNSLHLIGDTRDGVDVFLEIKRARFQFIDYLQSVVKTITVSGERRVFSAHGQLLCQGVQGLRDCRDCIRNRFNDG